MIGRYYHTLRHLHLRQWVWRPYLRLRKLAFTKVPFLRTRWLRQVDRTNGRLRPREPGAFILTEEWVGVDFRHHVEVAEQATRLTFRFLNQTRAFAEAIDWNCRQMNQLWRYNLHYHAYTISLGIAFRVTREQLYFDTFKRLVQEWAGANPMPIGDAWHPYVASLRACNWILASHLFAVALEKDADFAAQFRCSLVQQIVFVSENLELDVCGNHLIENTKALLLAGTYWTGAAAQRWLLLGLRLLSTELKRQVLSDGGHYERSPMYHAIVFEDLLVVAAALRNGGVEWPAELADALVRMGEFLCRTLHPDGEIALLNDSALGIAPSPSPLLAFANRLLSTAFPVPASDLLSAHYSLVRGTSAPQRDGAPTGKALAFPSTGYYGMRHSGSLLLVDAGPVCPDDLPAHAHADMFSYELSIRDRRWVVDSGVKEYAPGPWREYARSTRAHNTVTVAGRNQVDVWGAFRVGHRVYPLGVWHGITDDGDWVLTGHHAGFGLDQRHRRTLAALGGDTWVVVDEVSGTRPRPVQSLIHLHPDVDCTLQNSGAVMTQGEDVLHLFCAGNEDLELLRGAENPLNGWYMPQFGLAFPNPTLALTTHRLPVRMAYVLTTRSDFRSLRLESAGEQRSCTVTFAAETVEFVWPSRTSRPIVRRKTM